MDLHKRIPIEAFSQIQAASTARFYFAIPVMHEYDPASAIAVYDKRTGQRVQVLHLKSPGCDNGVDTVLVTTEQGKEQLRIAAPQTYCAEARFELNPKTQRFHDLEPGTTRLTSPY